MSGRLSNGAAVMLVAGYSGWAHFYNPFLGFAVVMAGWFFILLELLMGEAGQVAASGDKVNEHVKASFQTRRFIVTLGWSVTLSGTALSM